jgi:hypothetical protein
MGVAVNVTVVPWQTLADDATIETVGATAAEMLIETALEVTVAGAAQERLLVNTKSITSPLPRAAEAKVLVLVPAFAPFTLHW